MRITLSERAIVDLVRASPKFRYTYGGKPKIRWSEVRVFIQDETGQRVLENPIIVSSKSYDLESCLKS